MAWAPMNGRHRRRGGGEKSSRDWMSMRKIEWEIKAGGLEEEGIWNLGEDEVEVREV